MWMTGSILVQIRIGSLIRILDLDPRLWSSISSSLLFFSRLKPPSFMFIFHQTVLSTRVVAETPCIKINLWDNEHSSSVPKVIVVRDIGEAESNFDTYREVVNGFFLVVNEHGLPPKNCEWVGIPGETSDFRWRSLEQILWQRCKVGLLKISTKTVFLYSHEADLFGQTLRCF